MEKNYFSVLKVGEAEYMQKLYSEGEIYCNSTEYFTRLESNNLRGDPYDSAAYIQQIRGIELFHNSIPFAKADKGQFYIRNKSNKGNIYCLYGLSSDELKKDSQELQKLELDLSGLPFGETAVLIFDVVKFLNRIEAKLTEMGFELRTSPVQYYDHNSQKGVLTPFHKSNIYKPQNEIRLWIPNDSDDPLIFKIGSISDISKIMPKKELSLLKYKIS